MYEETGQNEQILIAPGVKLTEVDLDHIRAALSGLPGTELTDSDETTVTLEHYPEVVSRKMVVDALREAGYSQPVGDRLGPLERRLKRMADSSRATFGSGRLDCCNLKDD